MITTGNGSLLARVTGWRRVPMVLPDVGKLERVWTLQRWGLVAVMRYHPRGAVLYGPTLQDRRRPVLGRFFRLVDAIRRGNAAVAGMGGGDG